MKSIKLITAVFAVSALTACASIPNPLNVVTDAAAKTTGAVKSVAKGTVDVAGKTVGAVADTTKAVATKTAETTKAVATKTAETTKAVATKTAETAKKVVTPVEAHKDAAKKTATESIDSMKQSMDAKMVDTASTAKDAAGKPGTEIDKMSDAMNTKMKNASEKIDNAVKPSATK